MPLVERAADCDGQRLKTLRSQRLIVDPESERKGAGLWRCRSQHVEQVSEAGLGIEPHRTKKRVGVVRRHVRQTLPQRIRRRSAGYNQTTTTHVHAVGERRECAGCVLVHERQQCGVLREERERLIVCR